MKDERISERRSDIDRRTSAGRRITNDEWHTSFIMRRSNVADRRISERRGLDRRSPVK